MTSSKSNSLRGIMVADDPTRWAPKKTSYFRVKSLHNNPFRDEKLPHPSETHWNKPTIYMGYILYLELVTVLHFGACLKVCVFSMIRGSGCSKSRLAKAAGAEVAAQQRNEKWQAAVARSTFSSQNAQKPRFGPIFWSSDVEKSHTAVSRSTFVSQNAQKLQGFWSSDVQKLVS